MGLIEELKKKRDQAVALARKVPASPVSAVASVARKTLPNTSFNNPGSVAYGVANKVTPMAVRDVFDSNTKADQIRRVKGEERKVNYNPLAFGKSIGQNKKTYTPTPTPYRIPTSYEDEQKMKGNNRPFTNLGQQVVGNSARVLNTVKQQNLRTVPQALAGATLMVANRTGRLSNRDYNNAVNNVLSDKKVYGGYTDKGGVLNAGTVVDSPEQAKNLTTRDVVQKSVGYGMGTYGELSPIGAKGGFAGRTLLGATEGAIGDAGSQLVNTGRIDPRQTLGSALFGGTLSNAGPVASKLLGRNTPTPRTPDPRLNDADVSGLLKIKNGRGDFMDDVEYTKALESVRKAGIDITKPEAWSQIDGVLARYNQVLEGRGDPSMFDMGQSRFKPTPLNQGGYIKNPLAKDPLESLKQEARKYKSADEFRKNLLYNDDIILHQTGKNTADKINKEGFKSGKETGLGEKRSEVYGMSAYDWMNHKKFSKDTYARDGSDVAEVAIDTKGLKIIDRSKQKFTDEEYVRGIHKQIPEGYDGVKVGYGNGVNEVLLKPEVANARRFNIDDLYAQSQPPKSPLANDAPQGKTPSKNPLYEVDKNPQFSQMADAARKAKSFEEFANGTYEVPIKNLHGNTPEAANTPGLSRTPNEPVDIYMRQGRPVIDVTDGNHRLYEAKARGDETIKVKFNDSTKKGGAVWGNLRDFYDEANGSAPQVGKTLKETRTNTAGIKNYNPDGLPGPANRIVHDLGKYYESLGSRQGVDINHDTGVRVSNNSPAYRELFADLGRTPRSKDWYDYAYRQINDGTAPKEITDQFEKTLNFELSTDKTIQAPEALNPQGSIPIKNKPSDMPTSDWESLIRSRVPDQTKVDVVNNGGKLEIQKKTIAPITKQETVQQTIPTEVTPEVRVKPDKNFTVSTNQYLGTLESAETTARSLADTLPAKLKGQDAIDAIVAKDNGIRTGRPEIDSVNDQVDRIYNNLYAKYKDAGFDMGYVDDYSPRIYKNPKTGEAITKADYLFLTRTPGQTISRTAQNVNPDDLLYKTPQELLAHYTRTFERAKAGREYFDALKKSGHIVESGTRPDGMMVIDAPGMPQPSPRNFDGTQIQGNYYAYPEVAKKINKVFGVDEGNKFSSVTAKVAGKLQDIGLSGGVPFTPLNSFTFAQVTKELTAGKVSAPLKALFGSLSDKQAQKFFKNNAPIVEEMQKQGIRISSEYNTSTLNGFMDSLRGKTGSEKAGALWDRTMSDPTFKRFMPRLQVETYKQVKAKLLSKYPDAEASKLAGDLVKNFYGLTDLTTQATRSQTGSDIVSTVFFAPKYRESMAKFWVNNAKALDPRKINDPAYAQNIRFNIGATLLFGAMQGANMYLNGTPTWENPEGKKDKLIIPDKYVPFNTNGKDVGVPFLSSIATVPRNIATGLAGAVTGNFGEVGKSAKSFLGYGVRPLADLANNEDYFGSQIYKEDGSTGEKLGSGASYLTKAFMPPYIREGINAASNKLPEGVKDFVGARDQSGFETLARVGETPLRFYDPNYYRGEGDKFGTGGMTKAMADSEAGKKKTAKELEIEEKKLKQSYEKSFSKEDLKFLSKDSAERQKLIDNGIKTKKELDGLDRYALNKRKELGMPAGQLGAKEVPDKIDKTDDKVKSFYTDRSYVHEDDYETWQSSAPESDSSKDMIRRVSQMRPEGAPELPANNRTAELYADYKKEQANSKWSKLQETEKKKELLRTVYKTQLTDDQKFVDDLGTEKLISAIDNGQVDPNIMKSMVELDNALIKLGGTAMLSKTVRNRYGLGSAPSSGGSGSGKAKKPLGIGSFTLLPQKSSIGSVANLLKNARVSYKS